MPRYGINSSQHAGDCIPPKMPETLSRCIAGNDQINGGLYNIHVPVFVQAQYMAATLNFSHRLGQLSISVEHAAGSLVYINSVFAGKLLFLDSMTLHRWWRSNNGHFKYSAAGQHYGDGDGCHGDTNQ